MLKFPLIELSAAISYNKGATMNHYVHAQNIDSMEKYQAAIEEYKTTEVELAINLNIPSFGN